MNYEIIEGTPSDEIIDAMAKLEEACFETRPYDSSRLKYEFESKGGVVTVLAKDEAGYVGYKTGYERRRAQFYSWQGGVHPSVRGQGVGKELMARQHVFLKEKGYKRVRTQTGNEFRNMLILNLKSGFEVIGTFLNSKGVIRISLEKPL